MRGVSIERLQVSSALLKGLPEFTRLAGLDHDSIAAAVGLTDLDPENEDQFVNLDRFAKFLEIGAILTGDDSFGLRFADWRPPVPSGPLTFAMQNAPTVRAALQTLIKYVATRIDVAHMDFVVESDRAVVDWGFSPLLVRRWQFSDFAAGSLMNYMKPIVEHNWRPLSVTLVRPPPRTLDLHRRVFGRAIEFSQRTNAVAFPPAVLLLPIRDADPEIHKLACRLLDRILKERLAAADLVTSVREEIILALPTEEGAQLRRVARRLAMSVRSLQRHLADTGTSFQDLVDDTRKALASRYLEDPGLTFSQISYQLGFSAPSAFTRACHRWFGGRPGAVRRELRGALPQRELPPAAGGY